MKVGGLLVKTLAKPVARQLKVDAEHVGWLREACTSIGQTTNYLTSRLTHASSLDKWKKPYKHIELKATEAREKGAEIVSEGFVLTVAVTVMGYEYNRQNNYKEAAARKKKAADTRIAQQQEHAHQAWGGLAAREIIYARQLVGAQLLELVRVGHPSAGEKALRDRVAEKHDGSRYVQHNHADGTYEAYVKGSATHIIDRGRYSMVNGQYSEANFEGSHGTLQNDGTSVWIDHYAGVHGYHKYIATSDQYIGGIKVPPPPFPTGTWRGKWQTICCGCCPVDSGGDDLKLAFHENGTITGGATDPRNGSFKVSGTWSRDSVGSYKVKYTYSAPGNGNDGENAHGWLRGGRMETDWKNRHCSGKAQYDYDGVDGQEMEREI